jgi:hypothetical protein
MEWQHKNTHRQTGRHTKSVFFFSLCPTAVSLLLLFSSAAVHSFIFVCSCLSSPLGVRSPSFPLPDGALLPLIFFFAKCFNVISGTHRVTSLEQKKVTLDCFLGFEWRTLCFSFREEENRKAEYRKAKKKNTHAHIKWKIICCTVKYHGAARTLSASPPFSSVVLLFLHFFLSYPHLLRESSLQDNVVFCFLALTNARLCCLSLHNSFFLSLSLCVCVRMMWFAAIAPSKQTNREGWQESAAAPQGSAIQSKLQHHYLSLKKKDRY